jgi:hypothetical protein
MLPVGFLLKINLFNIMYRNSLFSVLHIAIKAYFVKKINMKKILLSFSALLFSACLFQANAQSEEEMKKWMDYSTPSDVHKMMASWDGNWKEEINFWMAPGAPPQKMESKCVNKMILGGRYQESKHIGDFGGMPFEGISTLAWDNAGKYFISTWIDNMGTGLTVLKGEWDAATKTITLKGEMMDAMTGKAGPMRETLKIVDENTQIMEQFNMKDGKEYKSMEIKFTRIK